MHFSRNATHLNAVRGNLADGEMIFIINLHEQMVNSPDSERIMQICGHIDTTEQNLFI